MSSGDNFLVWVDSLFLVVLLRVRTWNSYSWLSTWLYLEWTTIQNWRTQLWFRAWGWKTQVCDLDLCMEILRQRGYAKFRPRQGNICLKSQETKIRRSLSSRSAWAKQVRDAGMVLHTFNLGHTFCWETCLRTLEEERFTLLASLHFLASTSVGIYFCRRPAGTTALWDWATTKFLDFFFLLFCFVLFSSRFHIFKTGFLCIDLAVLELTL